MDVVYGLIPMMLIFGGLVVGVFIWMAKTGHFDDLDGAAHTIFMDDEFDTKPTHPAIEETQVAESEQKTSETVAKPPQG